MSGSSWDGDCFYKFYADEKLLMQIITNAGLVRQERHSMDKKGPYWWDPRPEHYTDFYFTNKPTATLLKTNSDCTRYLLLGYDRERQIAYVRCITF